MKIVMEPSQQGEAPIPCWFVLYPWNTPDYIAVHRCREVLEYLIERGPMRKDRNLDEGDWL